MTRPGIEPRSPGPLVNTLPTNDSIKPFTHRALMICAKIDEEIWFITGTLSYNDFLFVYVQFVIKIKIFNYNKIKPISTQRCPVYPIYPTPPLGQDMTQGQFLSEV